MGDLGLACVVYPGLFHQLHLVHLPQTHGALTDYHLPTGQTANSVFPLEEVVVEQGTLKPLRILNLVFTTQFVLFV